MIDSARYARRSIPAVVAVLLLAACGGTPDDPGSSAQALTAVEPICFANVDGICTQVPSCRPDDPLCSCAGLVCRRVPLPSIKPVPAGSQFVCDCPVPGAIFATASGGTI